MVDFSPIYTSRLSPLQTQELRDRKQQAEIDNDYLRRLALLKELREDGVTLRITPPLPTEITKKEIERAKKEGKIKLATALEERQKTFKLEPKTKESFINRSNQLSAEQSDIRMASAASYIEINPKTHELKKVVKLTGDQFDIQKTDERVKSFVESKLAEKPVFEVKPLEVAHGREILSETERALENLAHRFTKKCISLFSDDKRIILSSSGVATDKDLTRLRTELTDLQKFKSETEVEKAILRWQSEVKTKIGQARNPSEDSIKHIILNNPFSKKLAWGIYLNRLNSRALPDEIGTMKIIISPGNHRTKIRSIARSFFNYAGLLNSRTIIIAPNISADWLRPSLRSFETAPAVSLTKKDSRHLHSQIHGIEKGRPADVPGLRTTFPYSGLGRADLKIADEELKANPNLPTKKRIHKLSDAALTDSHCAEPNTLITGLMQPRVMPHHLSAKQLTTNTTEKKGATALCGNCKLTIPRLYGYGARYQRAGLDFRALTSYSQRLVYSRFMRSYQVLNPGLA